MSTRDIPTMRVNAAWSSRSGCWTLAGTCPLCQRHHFHGGGAGPRPDPARQYRPAWRRVLGVLAASEKPLIVSEIGDALAAQAGGPLQKRTIQDALHGLAEANEVDELGAHPGKASMWEARRES